ncbi:MAG: hypothetical protein IPH13_17220 [Planctomycetes bacterium]|nr:hypothetical protein [Planctomycetota bacterium]MCC7171592.1 hypothetical protein [Planctomycetota bacterium]
MMRMWCWIVVSVVALAGTALGSLVTMTGSTSVQVNAAGEKEVVIRSDSGTTTLGRRDEQTGAVGPWIDLLKAAEAGKAVTVELKDGKLTKTKVKP